MVYGDPTYWYNYYGYINNDNTVKPGQPYTAVWDPNNDGIVNWIDYIILSMNTKSRAGGWQPPE